MKKSITTLDLNLLLCLQLLMQERSVTKAAKRMNVTPSAVSKSLAKLRAWFDDPLFVNSPLGLSPTPLMVSMEQNLAEWMQMSNLLLDKPHHQTPRGLKFELAAESPLMMIMLNALSKRIYQRYPQATIKLRNWDYDSLDAITRGEVDIGFSGRESHPRSRELLSSLPLAIDYEVLFSDVPCVWLRKDHPALHETWNLQLLPIAGRLKCAHVNHVEALCDAEDVLVWSVAVTPTIEKLSVWELDGKHGWKSLPDIHSRANNPTSRMMRFAQLSTVKAFSPN